MVVNLFSKLVSFVVSLGLRKSNFEAKAVLMLLILPLNYGCDKPTFPINTILTTSSAEMREKADDGKPLDRFIYSIALRYGLNGVEQNVASADIMRIEAISQSIGSRFYSNGHLIEFDNPIVSQFTVYAVERCIAELTKTSAESANFAACGGKRTYQSYKEAWLVALAQAPHEVDEPEAEVGMPSDQDYFARQRPDYQEAEKETRAVNENFRSGLNSDWDKEPINSLVEFIAGSPNDAEIVTFLQRQIGRELPTSYNRELTSGRIEVVKFESNNYFCTLKSVSYAVYNQADLPKQVGSPSGTTSSELSIYEDGVTLLQGNKCEFKSTNSYFKPAEIKRILTANGWAISRQDLENRYTKVVIFIKGSARIRLEIDYMMYVLSPRDAEIAKVEMWGNNPVKSLQYSPSQVEIGQ